MSVVYSRSDPLISFQSATEHTTGIIDETFLSSYQSSSLSSSASQGLKQGENLNKNQISENFSDISFSSKNNIEDKNTVLKGGNSYNSSLSTTPSSSSSSSSSFSLSSFDNFQEKVTHIKMLITPMYSKFSISKKVRNFLS